MTQKPRKALLTTMAVDDTVVEIQTKKKLVRARGANQKAYLSNIHDHDLAFGIGPAGTGKTYLAVASAIDALENEQVRRIVLVRPAVEAGERLGFLPGDMSQKVDPYLRPMYDALYDMLGARAGCPTPGKKHYRSGAARVHAWPIT